MKQRIFSLFTALCLCLTLLPTAAFAEGDCAANDHTAPNDDGDCKTCGETIAAKLTHSGMDSYYTAFNAAHDAAETGDTITLLANLEVVDDAEKETVEIQKSITLELNGKLVQPKLKCATDNIEVTIQGSGELQMGFSFSGKSSVLTLTGGVDCKQISTQTGGTLNISSNLSENEGVTFYGGLTVTGTAQSPCTVNISGGWINALTVTGTENGSVNMAVTGGTIATLTVNGTKEQTTVTLNGGEFQKIECTTEGRTVGSLLPSQDYGYYNADTGEWEERTGTSIQSGNYIHVKILPLTGVTLSPSGTTSISPEDYAAGKNIPTFTADVARPEGATGELKYWWKVYKGEDVVHTTTADDTTINSFTFPANLLSGTFTVECKVSCAETGLSYTATAQVHIGKKLIPETWHPSGAKGLTYDGDEQCPVDQAFIKDVWDVNRETVKFYFRLGENGNWESNPNNIRAEDTGTYTVYWYIDGGDDYVSVGSKDNLQSFQVTIAPATVTVTSVVLNQKDYDGLTTATVSSVGFGSDATDCEYTATAEFDDPNAGEDKSFTATVTLTDSNYTFLNEDGQPTDTCTFRGKNGYIRKNTLSSLSNGILTVYNRFAHTYEYAFSPLLEGLKANLPMGCTLGEFSYDGIRIWSDDESLKSIIGEASYDETTHQLSLPIKNRNSDLEVTDGSLQLYVALDCQNYKYIELGLDIHLKNPDRQTLTVSLDSWSYGEAPKALTYGAEGLVISNDAETTITYTGTDSAGTAYNSTTPPTNAGNYTVAVSILVPSQSKLYEGSKDFTIAKATLTGISVEQVGTLTYTGSAQTPQVKTTVPDGLTVTFTYCTQKDGTYGSMPEIPGAGYHLVYYKADAANYETYISYFTVIIDKATPTVNTAPTANVTYGDTVKDTDISGGEMNVPGSFKWKDDVTSYGDATNGTTKTLQATFTPTDTTNYNIVDVDVSVTVNKADLPTSEYPTDLTGTKGNKLSTVKLPTGWHWLNNGETVMDKTGQFLAVYDGDTNHNPITSEALTVTVTDKEIPTITADALTATYGETGKKINATVTGDGTISYKVKSGSDVLDVDTTTGVLTFKKAGTATVTVSVSETATYAATSKDVAVTVNKAALTVTAKNQSIKVNGTVPDLTNPVKDTHYTVSGLVNGDTLSVSMEYQKDGDPVTPDVTKTGTYDIVITATADTEKYEVTNTSGTLTISKPSSGNGSSSNTTSTTVKNPDGSTTTTTTTDKKTGTVTVTTTTPNGTTSTIVTDKDGNSTTTVSVSKKDAQSGEIISLPVDEVKAADSSEDATEITVKVPSGGATIEVPVENPTAGTVIVVVDKDGNETIMPTTKQTENGVSVTLTEDATIKVIENSKDFSDVKSSDYFNRAVDWASSRGITGGNSATTFGPYDSCTRAQLVTFLWRAAGQPEAANESSMTDVAQNAYYTDAVAWAFENGIVGGYGNGLFGSEDTITREQMAVILYRFAQHTGMDTTQGGMAVREYKDYESVSDYAVAAIQWAVNAGVMQGYDGNLMPGQPCTRAQIVTMLYRLLGQ